jgi:hypothetical protein
VTEFATTSIIEVRVDQSSLRDARKIIEDDLGDVTVDVDASSPSGQLSNSGSAGVERRSRENALSRQLLNSQSDTLSGIQETIEERPALDEWETQHELSQERNDLLRELVETTEDGNFQRAKSGGLGVSSMLGGALGLSMLGAVGIGTLITGTISFADRVIGEIDISDYIDDSGDGSESGEDAGDVTPVPPPVPVTPGPRTPRPTQPPSPTGPSTPDGPPAPDSPPSPVTPTHPNRDPNPDRNPLLPSPGSNRSPSPGDNGGMGIPTPSPSEAVGLGSAGIGAYLARNTIRSGISSATSAVGGTSVGFPAPSSLLRKQFSDLLGNPEKERRAASMHGPGGFGIGGTPASGSVSAERLRGRRPTNRRTDRDRSSESRTNKARERRQQRGDIIVKQKFRIDGASKREIERKMREAKKEAVREVEKKLGGGGGSGSARMRR